MKNRILAGLLSLGCIGTVTAQSPYFQAVTNLNPVAYWPLQETISPPAADVEPNLGSLGAVANAFYSSTNVVKGVTPTGIIGDADTAVDFQSGLNGSFLAVPMTDPRVSLPAGPFTVEAWVFPTNSSASTVIAQTGAAGSGGLNNSANSAGWSLNIGYVPSLGFSTPNTVSFHVYNGVGSGGGAESSVGSSSFIFNNWYHVVGVFDGTNAILYVNGVAASPGIQMSGRQARDTWDPLTIGCGRGLNNNRFGGALDEVAIYTNALSAARVAAHYNNAISGSGGYEALVLSDNPYMYWRMDAPDYTNPDPSTYPAAVNFGSADAGGLYLSGTSPGVAGPSLSGFGSPSYACAFNGIGTDTTNALQMFTNGAAFSTNTLPASSGVTLTNLDDALNLHSNSISVLAWFKSNPADNRFQTLAGHGDSSWRLAMGNGGNAGHLQWNYGAGGDLVSTRIYNDGQWHFVAAVYTNSGAAASPAGLLATNYIYVDGILDNSVLITNNASATSTTNVLLGGAPDSVLSGNNNVYRPQRFFAGSLAHVAYLTNALTASQVANLYVAAGGVPTPVITGQPVTGRTNSPGTGNNGSGPGSYIFFGVNTIGATGYQWYFNSTSNYSGATQLTDGAKYTNTTTVNMTVTNLVDTDSGYYFVVVTNNYGSVTSILATFKVINEPFIISQTPAGNSLQLNQNQNYTLFVSASGETNFTYQWYTNGVADTATGTSSTYPLINVQPAMSGNTYQCVVGNAIGSASSTQVTLTVSALPPNMTSSAYSTTLLGMTPSGYWPMHEVSPGVGGDVETNLGTLGNLANAYYADWTGSIVGTGIVHQVGGALAGDSDPATGFNNTANNGSPTYPGFLVVPRTSPATTLKPPFTLETWAKPYTSGFGDILSENGSLNGVNNQNVGVRLSWGSGGGGAGTAGFQVFVGNGTGRNALPGFPTGYSIGQWYHVACTFDGATWILYVNGLPVVTQPTNATFTLAVDTGSPICIASGLWSGTGPGRDFPGAIDEVAVYTNVLDPSEIANHYNAGLNPNASPSYKQLVLNTNPIVYLRMDAPAYKAPVVSTWQVLNNYGSVGGNGVYSPGSLPGLVSGGLNANGLSSENVLLGGGMSSFADAGSDPAFNPTTNAFSYSAWFRGNPGDSRSFQTIVGHSDSSWRAAINSSGKLQAHAGNNGDLTSGAMVNDGNWHHFVMTFTGTNTVTHAPGTNLLYLDGSLVASGVNGTANPGTTLDVMLGNDPQYTNNPYGIGRCLAGNVCEVAFWNNQVISSNQARALWDTAGVPVFITSQPISGSANQGSSFTNSLAVNGSGTFAYQWYRDNLPIPTAGQTNLLTGGTNASLIINPVLPSDASADYYVVITNAFGSVTSSVASLTVFTRPVLSNQLPATYTNLYTLFAGSTPTFSLSAEGATPLLYQWYSNGVAMAGATNPNVKLNPVQAGPLTNFCIVSNFVGTITSTVWTASVVPGPVSPYPQAVLGLNPVAYWRLDEGPELGGGDDGVISHDYVGGNDGIYTNVDLAQEGYNTNTDPTTTSTEFGSTGVSFFDSYAGQVQGIDFSAPTNSSATFSVSVWAKSFAQVNGAGIVTKGYGNGGEQFDLDVFGSYRFFVRDAGGGVHGPTSTFKPDDNWHHLVGVCDEVNGLVSLYIDGQLAGQSQVAPGAGLLASTNVMSIGARRSNATTNHYDLQYVGFLNDVAIFNRALTLAQVQSIYLATGIPPVITQQPPASATVSENGTLMVSTTAFGTIPLSYQWNDLSGPLSGQTNATLVLSNVPAADNGDSVYLTVTNLYGSTNSTSMTLNVISGPPQITVSNLPPQVILPLGKTYTYSLQAVGTFPLTYQWYHGGTALPGQTNSSFVAVGSTLGTSTYSVIASNIDGTASGSSLLTVVAAPSDSYAGTILNLNPVGYWPLQETNPPAPATIETNYGSLGRVANAYYAITADHPRVTFGQSGAMNSIGDADSAVLFSGPSGTNYAFVPRTSPALTLVPPISIEVWLNSSDTKNFSDLVGEGAGNGTNGSPNLGGIRLCYGGNDAGGPNLQLFIGTGNGTTRLGVGTPANSLSVGLWHHCVATYDGTNTVLYVDSVPLFQGADLSGASAEAPDYWSPITIGDGLWAGSGTGGQRSYYGYLDEVAIYTNILSATQVTNHFVAGTSTGNYFGTVMSDNPLIYYRMDAQNYVSTDPNLCPEAVNFGSAPVNGFYPSGTSPGSLAGPPIVAIRTNLASPINGVTACIDAGNDPSFDPTNHQPFSALLWFKTYPSDDRVATLMSHGTTNWAMNLDGTTGKVVWNLFNGGQVTSTNILNDARWHFAAGVYDGTNSYLYVDGTLNSSGAAASVLASETGAELFLGGNPDFTVVGLNQRYLGGGIAQAALFTNALSPAQIAQLYSVATAPPVPTISVARSGNQIVITYTGTLLSSTNATGPYLPVNGASQPYIISPSEAKRFFRSSNTQ